MKTLLTYFEIFLEAALAGIVLIAVLSLLAQWVGL